MVEYVGTDTYINSIIYSRSWLFIYSSNLYINHCYYLKENFLIRESSDYIFVCTVYLWNVCTRYTYRISSHFSLAIIITANNNQSSIITYYILRISRFGVQGESGIENKNNKDILN